MRDYLQEFKDYKIAVERTTEVLGYFSNLGFKPLTVGTILNYSGIERLHPSDNIYKGTNQWDISGEEFMKGVNNMKKEFTKSDLVIGKHVIVFENGEEGLYLLNEVISNEGCPIISESIINDDLTTALSSSEEYNIVEVKEAQKQSYGQSLERMFAFSKSIWKRRDSETPQQKRLRELEEKQRELANEIAKMREEM